MTKDRNPLVGRYLDQLAGGLDRAPIPAAERLEILGEIESHLAEAIQSGVPLGEALEKLGSADALAQAYCLELAINPRPGADRSTGQRALRAVTRAAGLLSALLLVVVMGGLGLGLAVGGTLGFLAGMVAPFLPSAWLEPTLRAGLPQLVVIATSIVLLAVGVFCLRLVYVNFRALMAALRKHTPGVAK